MPQPTDPSTHDDLIEINVTFADRAGAAATLTDILVLQDDVTPGGGRYAEYASTLEVAADVTLGNLNATSQAIADIMFGQTYDKPQKILFGQVDFTVGGETAAQALDAVIAAGAQFYGVLYQSRDTTRLVALATDIEDKADQGASSNYFVFATQSNNADWLTSGIPAAFSAIEGFERTVMYYHDDNGDDAVSDRLDAAHLACRLSSDPDEKAVGWNSVVQEVDLLETAHTQAQKEAARANFANTARPLGRTATGDELWVDPGYNLNGRPGDHIQSADWLRIRTAEAVADLFVARSKRGAKITVDEDGQTLISGAINGVILRGVDIGHFDETSQLSSETITQDDRDNQRLRFSGEIVQEQNVRQVQINLNFGTTPIA